LQGWVIFIIEEKKRIKVRYKFLVILILSLLTITSVTASEYTRENSEKLHHLIDWHEYTPKTFEKAIKEQKPIYLVISAPSWCYWCHVYESEDYLFNKNLYPYINENFIPIFVDSDKRPDLTRKYLEGGWPSTTILTPNMMRIQGFSGPRDVDGLREYLESVIDYLKGKDFSSTSAQLNYDATQAPLPTKESLTFVDSNLLTFMVGSYDSKYGGLGTGDLPAWREGQKFPKPLAYSYLLDKYLETNNEKYLEIVKFTFDNQYTNLDELETRYHLYDPVEGGFHRYGTKRDWSVPHYEKLLGDQAKFILSLNALYNLTQDNDVKTALDGTINFVLNKFYDSEGGFYSSQDAHLEAEYFEKTKEERQKLEQPYIDKTRQMDSNGLMIFVFLELFKDDPKYKDVVTTSLDFTQKNMLGKHGAFYYYDYDKKESILTGQSIANSWALLSFVHAYNILDEDKYLEEAQNVAQYSLDNLYDWKSGAFFERNSKDEEFYSPNEMLELNKPTQENGVFAYGLLKLYLATDQLEYLEAGLNSLGLAMQRLGNLDDSYFVTKSMELVKDNDLLTKYSQKRAAISQLVNKRQQTFFLNKLLEENKQTDTLDDAPKLLDDFTNAGFIVLAIIAFLAGILSFLSPCCLPVLSAYFAHNFRANRGEILKNTLFFFFGLATVFSIFGMGATLLGTIFRENRLIFTKTAGAIIIIFGILELFGKGFSGLNLKLKGNNKTPIGSYLFGAVFAVGWSACIGPILASLLLLSATSGTVIKGSALLFIYALGLGIPLIVASLYFDKIKNQRFWNFLRGREVTLFKKKFHTTYLVSGIILIILGALIFNDYLFKLNQFALQTTFVQEIIIKGEEFLKQLFIR
jgi:cytochrome c-type biogenesis protein